MAWVAGKKVQCQAEAVSLSQFPTEESRSQLGDRLRGVHIIAP